MEKIVRDYTKSKVDILKEELLHNDTSSGIIRRCDLLYQHKKSVEQRITSLLNIKHPEIGIE